ncbi:MAG TPA: BatA domain-containing protein [Gemmatimonadales bacterium]|nr:BatA domain-containing protein [Gemmatimonadales bacterium]
MTFLHPWLLLGLAVAAIPVLLHLLERRTPPEADFPALRYLSEAERQSARRLRLRHLLLLLLRTALIALVVFGAAAPVIPAAGGGVHEPTAMVLIFDNSLSSGAVVDGKPVLDRLRLDARASFAAARAEDRLWLILADGMARGGTAPGLAAVVDSASASPQRLDLVAVTARALEIVNSEPLRAREVEVVSDLQASALGPGSVSETGGARVLVLEPSVEPPLNRGVGVLRVTDGAVAVPVVGTSGAPPAAVTVRLHGRTVGPALAAPGSAVSLPLPQLGPGWWVGDVVLDPDELRADDHRVFVSVVAPPAGVRAAPAAGPFVAAALAVLREGRRVTDGSEVVIDGPGRVGAIVTPSADPALMGEVNRSLAARGAQWRYGAPGTPGPIVAPRIEQVSGVLVLRRYQLGGGAVGDVMASVNGEPWLVRDHGLVLLGSRLDTAWTALPATPGFVPFVDALVNRLARGTTPADAAEGRAGVVFRLRGTDTIGATVFGPDPRESDLTRATPAAVTRALGSPPLAPARFAAARFAGTHRVDASAWFLGLALLVALVELGIATRTD